MMVLSFDGFPGGSDGKESACNVRAAAAKSLQSCPTPSNHMDCSLPGSSVHGILQARVLEWDAIAFSGNVGDLGSIPGLGRSPGGEHGNPLQYSCLLNSHGQISLVGCRVRRGWATKHLPFDTWKKKMTRYGLICQFASSNEEQSHGQPIKHIKH